MSETYDECEGIAILAMAIRFPGAKTLEQFWRNLSDGVESITLLSDAELESSKVDPALRSESNYVNAAFILDDIDLFDASFFGFTPREAETMDPQQRIFLELAWEAIERAGYNCESYKGRVGVYAGVGTNAYLLNLYLNPNYLRSVGLSQALLGNEKDFLTTRVSYKLNLKGPSINVQTSCSTSLVAVHLACQSLLNGESDLALAGGVTIRIPQKAGYFYQDGFIASPDGHCRAFDAKAQGCAGGSGAGIVVLKRLADAISDGDTIHAVIKGSGVNNDGHMKVGFTAPGVDGQADAIAEALAMAGIEPETLSYIEAHGTGTILGDPIELAALNQVVRGRTNKKGFCAIGSVKTNVGHLDTAAGIAGLIKTVLALEHRLIPPSLNFQEPNPQIDFANSPFYVNTILRPWKAGPTPRRAGVSSFGIGGTNAHVIVEEGPILKPSGPSRNWLLLPLSARSTPELEAATVNLHTYLKAHPEVNLADVAYTLQCGRKAFDHRRVLLCRNVGNAADAIECLNAGHIFTGVHAGGQRQILFMFSGQGSQYLNMAAELYHSEITFREQVEKCSELLLGELGFNLLEALYAGEDQEEAASARLKQTQVTQPALFVMEYALAKLWMSWGIQPVAMIGHSIGEYVAACLAGVFSLKDALELVATRARLMQSVPAGAMMAVTLSEQEVIPLLGENLSLAAVNGPSQCVVSGTIEAIDNLEKNLDQRNVIARRLETSHAFHSPMMEPILTAFRERVAKARLDPPLIPYVSNLTGTWVTSEQAMDADYWVRHLRQTVRFAEGLEELMKEPERVLLEVGPGQTLSQIARNQSNGTRVPIVLSTLSQRRQSLGDIESVMGTLGKLWVDGVDPDWEAFYAGQDRRRVELPTYPFARQRYWVESLRRANDDYIRQPPSPQAMLDEWIKGPATPGMKPTTESSLTSPPTRRNLQSDYVPASNELEATMVGIWEELLGVEQVGIHDNFFELGGHSLLAVQLSTHLRQTFPVELPIRSLFESPTVAELAEVIEEELIKKLELEELPAD